MQNPHPENKDVMRIYLTKKGMLYALQESHKWRGLTSSEFLAAEEIRMLDPVGALQTNAIKYKPYNRVKHNYSCPLPNGCLLKRHDGKFAINGPRFDRAIATRAILDNWRSNTEEIPLPDIIRCMITLGFSTWKTSYMPYTSWKAIYQIIQMENDRRLLNETLFLDNLDMDIHGELSPDINQAFKRLQLIVWPETPLWEEKGYLPLMYM